jgi:hypothetical protein
MKRTSRCRNGALAVGLLLLGVQLGCSGKSEANTRPPTEVAAASDDVRQTLLSGGQGPTDPAAADADLQPTRQVASPGEPVDVQPPERQAAHAPEQLAGQDMPPTAPDASPATFQTPVQQPEAEAVQPPVDQPGQPVNGDGPLAELAERTQGSAAASPPNFLRPRQSGENTPDVTGPDVTGPAGGSEAPDRPQADVRQLATVDAQQDSRPASGGGGQQNPEAEKKDEAEKDDEAEQRPLFEGWPTPRAVLVFTGRQYGYLEPCGCSGLDNQTGGLIRRDTLLSQMRDKGWTLVPIDAGNQVRRYGRQPEIKFQITIEGLKMMGYQAIALGPDDLRLSTLELVSTIAPADGQPGLFMGANTVVLDRSFTAAYRVLEANGVRIGVTAVLGQRERKRIISDEVQTGDAGQALAELWPRMKQEACDLYVLVVQGSLDESIELGRRFPGFAIVVTTGGGDEPRMQPETIKPSGNWLVETGNKAMFVGAVGIFDGSGPRLRYQRIPLDKRFKDSKQMLRLLAAYQDQLKEAGLEGLGIRPQPHPTGLKFVGSEMCSDCHPNEYDIWKKGHNGEGDGHAHAYATLLNPPKRANVPRNHDPECISCHVVGWNPQKYYPYESGYLSRKETPQLINMGCENCHGPGSAHVDAEYGEVEVSEQKLADLRQSMVLPLKRAKETCLQCHDLDNSPAFLEEGAFKRYWSKIRH